MSIELFPRVFHSKGEQRLFVRLPEGAAEPSIKIQSMGHYSVPHVLYRIDEENRCPYMPLDHVEGDVYSCKYEFTGEGRYTVRIRLCDRVVFWAYLYAVDSDLMCLTAMKGDTHLHTCCSDGTGTPFELSCTYRAAGYDFIAVTDHHKYAPSLEARDAISALTDKFTVFPGEEVHNKNMGYFHVVNFNASASVNDIIETDDDYVDSYVAKIKSERSFPEGVDPHAAAYRIFIADHIRSFGGLAIMAHPFWDAYGEYNMQTADCIYHLKNRDFDALELLAGNDNTGNGNNLQIALWADLRAEGAKINVLGASDCHDPFGKTTRFNREFSIVFAEAARDIPDAIKAGMSVAVKRRSDTDFDVYGPFRLVSYARFLLAEFYPTYATLTAAHAQSLSAASGAPTDDIRAAEQAIDMYKEKFFAS